MKYLRSQQQDLSRACPANYSTTLTSGDPTSELEKTNEGYAIAKISSLKYCQYIKQKQNKYANTDGGTAAVGEGVRSAMPAQRQGRTGQAVLHWKTLP